MQLHFFAFNGLWQSLFKPSWRDAPLPNYQIVLRERPEHRCRARLSAKRSPWMLLIRSGDEVARLVRSSRPTKRQNPCRLRRYRPAEGSDRSWRGLQLPSPASPRLEPTLVSAHWRRIPANAGEPLPRVAATVQGVRVESGNPAASCPKQRTDAVIRKQTASTMTIQKRAWQNFNKASCCRGGVRNG